MTQVIAVLLDVDGTLIDSNDAHAAAWAETLERFGHPVELAKVRALIGEGADKVLPALAKLEKDSPRGKEIVEARSAWFKKEYLPSILPLPGARDLLVALHARGLRLVIATSAAGHELEGLIAPLDAEGLFHGKTTSSDAARSKPDPDIIHAAIARAGCAPRECVMIGDTPYDVLAARRAGVRVIAFRSGGWKDDALEGATAIYDGPADLLANLETSLLA